MSSVGWEGEAVYLRARLDVVLHDDLGFPVGALEAGEPPAVATKTPVRTLLPSVAGRYKPRNEVTDAIAYL